MKLILAALCMVCSISISGKSYECEEPEIKGLSLLKSEKFESKIKVDFCLPETISEALIMGVALSSEKKEASSSGTPTSISNENSSIELIIGRPQHDANEFTSNMVHINIYKNNVESHNFHTKKLNIKWDTINTNDKIPFVYLTTLNTLAVNLIDKAGSSNLKKAKTYLDFILHHSSDFIDAYPELARYTMKTESFGVKSTGILRAEQILLSALEIDQNHANTRVLLGYVYSWQERFEEALEEFKSAESLGTNNLWLYTNWGEMHLKQDKKQEAIKYYLRAVQPERPYNTYDRAMKRAYSELFDLLISEKEYHQLKEINLEASKKYPKSVCYKTKALLVDGLYLDNYEKVIEEVEGMKKFGCTDFSNELKSLAYLRLWAENFKSNPKISSSYYRKATIVNTNYVSLLAMSSKYPFGEKLLSLFKTEKRGLDIRDANDYTALLRVIGAGDIDAARRLINSGADINIVATQDEVTPLMVAVLSRSEKMVTFMLQQKVSLKSKTVSGATAKDIANYFGLKEIVKLLDNQPSV